MLSGRANDIKRHRWFDGFDWDGVITRKMAPPRKPRDDSSKRLKELTVRLHGSQRPAMTTPCTHFGMNFWKDGL